MQQLHPPHNFISPEKLASPDYFSVLSLHKFADMFQYQDVPILHIFCNCKTMLVESEYQFSQLCTLSHDLMHLVLLDNEEFLWES